jgi:tryptophanyl-tRNA synthetase
MSKYHILFPAGSIAQHLQAMYDNAARSFGHKGGGKGMNASGKNERCRLVQDVDSALQRIQRLLQDQRSQLAVAEDDERKNRNTITQMHTQHRELKTKKTQLEDMMTSSKISRGEWMDKMKSDEGEALKILEEGKEV